MREWTPAAREEFDRYCASVRDKLAAEGADPDEVKDDLQAHVEREAGTAGLSVLTREDVEQILARVGPVGDRPQAPRPEPPPPSVVRRTPLETRPWFQWACGVVLPVITIAVEAVTGLCASVFFDPIPTPAHVVLAAFVPAANTFALLQLRRGVTVSRRVLQLASGAAVAISFLYAIPFLLLLPLSVIGLIYFGLGLLPLTPPLAFIASIRIALRVRREAGETGFRSRGLALGFVAAVLLALLIDLPKTATNVGLRLAGSEDATSQRRGLRLLRTLGSNEYLLRACYDRSGMPPDLLSFLLLPMVSGSVGPAEARVIYYRVTGDAFNAVPPPKVGGLRGADPTQFWDFDQGGTGVGATVKGLSLASSRLDGSLDADAALAYVEWTFEFQNAGRVPSEARAQIALPPGGVVSRVTLWINGEEREAAFGGRGEVRAAYENVVRARRDPILVTTAGPDRILVQCFPVVPGQVMKARLGITAPLLIEDPSRGTLVLPHLVERNFRLPSEMTHAVWLETKGRFSSTPQPYTLEPLATGGQAMRGAASEAALQSGAQTIAVERDARQLEAWTPADGDIPPVRQTLRPRAPAVKRLVVVLDGSRGGSLGGPALAGALARVPPGVEVAVVLAGDEARVLAQPASGPEAAALVRRHTHFAGGVDNVPALVQAWDLAAVAPHGTVLWVHGPQPVRLGGTSALAQRWTRRPDGPRLLALPVQEGPNLVFDELGEVPSVANWPRRGVLANDIESALGHLVGTSTALEAVREETVGASLPAGVPTSSHVRRLWAADRVRAALATGEAAARKEATALAVRHRIVTPVSGAVVLETAAQYKAAGLEPPAGESVPTIPEPETWLLLMVVAGLLVWASRRRVQSA